MTGHAATALCTIGSVINNRNMSGTKAQPEILRCMFQKFHSHRLLPAAAELKRTDTHEQLYIADGSCFPVHCRIRLGGHGVCDA